MIFVTVGTQLPFDRLIKSVDEWVKQSGHQDVYAQTGMSSFTPSNMPSTNFMGVKEFDRRVAAADLLISHAGMGSIITAIEMSKPIVVMPRLAMHGEHRNDHQRATVSKFKKLSNVFVAENEHELADAIDEALSVKAFDADSEPASRSALISYITSFIDGNGS